MTEETETQTISRALVPERDRTDLVDALFGINFPLQLEPCVFAVASELSSDYRGGYWAFHSLGNGGFYMAPDDDARFTVRSENGYEGTMTADAFGVTVCLYAYSRLSFIAGDIAEDLRAALPPAARVRDGPRRSGGHHRGDGLTSSRYPRAECRHCAGVFSCTATASGCSPSLRQRAPGTQHHRAAAGGVATTSVMSSGRAWDRRTRFPCAAWWIVDSSMSSIPRPDLAASGGGGGGPPRPGKARGKSTTSTRRGGDHPRHAVARGDSARRSATGASISARCDGAVVADRRGQ